MDKDLDGKGLRRTFFRYAVPSVAAMWIFSFYSMVDGYFVARGVGPMALASVNIAMPYINLIFGISILCSAGASTVISIHLGRGDVVAARRAFMVDMVFLSSLSLCITVGSLVWGDPLARFLGATPALFADVRAYLRIVSLFVLFFILTYYFEVTVRADGYPRLAAISVGAAAAANIVLDYLFVMVFHWGVAGAAWATGIAQLLSTLLLLSHFLGRRARLRFSRFEFRLEELVRSVRLGFGDAVTEFSVGAAIFLFNRRILQIVGAEGVVGYTVMAYVTTLVVMTMSGISQGMQPLLSYQYGRGDEARCRYLLSLALKTAVCCSIAWFALMEVFTGAFVRLFIDAGENAALLADSVRAFRIYAVSYLFIGVNVVLATYFSSVERPIFGVALSASRGLFVIAASLFAMSAIFGELGIWLSPVVSEVACLGVAAFCLHALRSGKGAVRAVETA